MTAGLLQRLVDHHARPPGPRMAGEVRALLEELAATGAPPGGETLARQLVFDHLDVVQDQLPPAAAAKLEALLEPAEAPLATAVPSPALDARVLDAVRRERPSPARVAPPPAPAPRVAPWLGLAQLSAALMVAGLVAVASLNSTGTSVNGLIAKPPPLQVRLDRGENGTYRSGETIFIQLACAQAGHLALLACRADGKPGVALADQRVVAGQVVVDHLAIGVVAGKASVIGVLSSEPLPGLVERMDHLPRPCTISTIMESIDRLATERGTRVVYATGSLSIVP